jgi:AraC-like DNA-binding protein
VLARHRHGEAFAALVLSGDYVEAGDSGRHRVSAGDVIFHAAYEQHLDRFGCHSAEVLLLPIARLWDGPVVATVDDPDAIVRLSERSAREAVGTLLATMTERKPAAEDWPDLLAADLLREPGLRLAQWSSEHRLHPGSLARAFRQQFGVTPAEFRSIARTRRAMRHLERLPLSEAAAESGFADQAHMSRAIKRATDLSPRRFKERLAADQHPGSL